MTAPLAQQLRINEMHTAMPLTLRSTLTSPARQAYGLVLGLQDIKAPLNADEIDKLEQLLQDAEREQQEALRGRVEELVDAAIQALAKIIDPQLDAIMAAERRSAVLERLSG